MPCLLQQCLIESLALQVILRHKATWQNAKQVLKVGCHHRRCSHVADACRRAVFCTRGANVCFRWRPAQIAQAMSTRVDIVPEAYLVEFAKMQDAVPPMPTAQARAILEAGARCLLARTPL